MSNAKNFSRRDFLKAGTASAGLTLAGGLSVARGAHLAGGDELKIALIGCGGAARARWQTVSRPARTSS